jgi:hypothetical protein
MKRLVRGMGIGFAVLGLCVGLGCREKTPYPKLVAPGTVPEPKAPSTQVGTPTDDPQGLSPVRPWLLVVAPEGSFLVSSRPGGADLAVRRTPALVRVTGAGAVRGLLVRSRDIPGSQSARSSNIATLQPAGFAGPAVRAGTVEAEDVTAAFEADPEMSAEFHHQETLTALGVRDGVSTWLASSRGFLGGAHPYAVKRLLVVDLETGRPVPGDPGFSGRDLVSEVLGRRAAESCVRRLSGVAPVEGPGGEPAWMVGLTHEFESCAGEFVGARVDPPLGAPPVEPVEGVSFADGTLTVSDPDLSVGGVVDWRVSPDRRAVVTLMARDRRDEAPLPWSAERTGKRRHATRELHAWEVGMERPVVIGRVSALLSVQFLDGHPASDRIVPAFEGL